MRCAPTLKSSSDKASITKNVGQGSHAPRISQKMCGKHAHTPFGPLPHGCKRTTTSSSGGSLAIPFNSQDELTIAAFASSHRGRRVSLSESFQNGSSRSSPHSGGYILHLTNICLCRTRSACSAPEATTGRKMRRLGDRHTRVKIRQKYMSKFRSLG